MPDVPYDPNQLATLLVQIRPDGTVVLEMTNVSQGMTSDVIVGLFSGLGTEALNDTLDLLQQIQAGLTATEGPRREVAVPALAFLIIAASRPVPGPEPPSDGAPFHA